MAVARVLIEGELKRIEAWVSKHRRRLPGSGSTEAGKATTLEMAAFVSGFYGAVERLLHIMFKTFELEIPSTVQHHTALIDAAARKRSHMPAFLPPEIVADLRHITLQHFATRHHQGSELDSVAVQDLARRIPGLWNQLQSHYKEILREY